MKTICRLLPIVCACITTQAFATDPPANSADQDKSKTSTSEAAAPSKPTRIELEDKTLTNAEVKGLFNLGYKPVSRNGEVQYCRNETETGSRFATMTCRTADQMKQLVRDSKDMLAAQQKTGGSRQIGK